MRELGSVDAVTEPSPAPYDPCGGGNLRREARHADGADLPPVRHQDSERDPGRLRALRVDRGGDPTLSDLALELVDGPRAQEYDEPALNLERIGAAWGAVLGIESIPGWQVALCMAALKCVRAGHKATDDSLIDAVGYLEIARRLRP